LYNILFNWIYILKVVLDYTIIYEGCPESIQPFWISREPVAWPWCNLAASRRRLYCASVNSHSPVGLASRQWDAVDWACVLCGRPWTVTHYRGASQSAVKRRWLSFCTVWPSVNSHSSVGLVSLQWDAVDWACVLCDRPWAVTLYRGASQLAVRRCWLSLCTVWPSVSSHTLPWG